MNYYETIIIFDGRCTEKEYNELVKNYSELLRKSLPATIKETDRMGKKKLAYSYKRKGVEVKDGWYVVFTYMTHPENITKLERSMRIDDKVLKFLTIKRDKEDVELEEYAEVTEIEEEAKSPAELNVESEQSSGLNSDCWDKVFDLQGVR